MKKECRIKNITAGGMQTIYLTITNISISDLLTCIDEDKIRNLCYIGCSNYKIKWSCPPYSPMITDILSMNSYEKMILICGHIDLKDMLYIKNSYRRVRAANMILKSKCEQIARSIEDTTNGYSLLSGSCNLCKPCYKKRGVPCNKPSMMRYSMESTGINVEQLIQNFCNHKLEWYEKGVEQEYTSAVTAVLFKDFDETKIGSINKYLR